MKKILRCPLDFYHNIKSKFANTKLEIILDEHNQEHAFCLGDKCFI
jgi:hypothetical protein